MPFKVEKHPSLQWPGSKLHCKTWNWGFVLFSLGLTQERKDLCNNQYLATECLFIIQYVYCTKFFLCVYTGNNNVYGSLKHMTIKVGL